MIRTFGPDRAFGDQNNQPSVALDRRKANDAWVLKMNQTINKSTQEQEADAVAAALAEGLDPEAVGEAISLAAKQLVSAQRPPGRTATPSVYTVPMRPMPGGTSRA